MKLVKSLLLGTTAIVAAAGAQAADLPVRKAAVVENVCANLGTGFAGAWVMPGTDTCVQLSGYARAEYFIRDRESDAFDATGFRVEGRLNFDVRHASEIGLIRGYVRLVGTTTTNFAAQGFGGVGTVGALGTGALAGTFQGTTGIFGAGTAGAVILDSGFVEIQNATGQFLAGRSTNNFQPGPGGDRYTGARFRDGTRNEQFAYTFGLGQGITLTAAVENPLRVNSFAFVPGALGTVAGTFGFDPLTGLPLAGGANVTGLVYAGQEAPDFIGRLQVGGTWGRAWLSGAVHQVSDIGIGPTAAAVAAGVNRPAADDEIGFAVEGTAEANLPFLTTGSLAWVLAGYSDGAIGYMGFTTQQSPGGLGVTGGGAPGIGPAAVLAIADAVVVNGNIETTEAWHVAAGVRFQLTPQWRANIYGSYAEVDFADGANRFVTAGTIVNGVNVGGTRSGFVDFEEGIIAGNIIWTPARNLDLGLEVLYQRVNFDGNVAITTPTNFGSTFTTSVTDNVDDFIARFRVNRAF